MKVDKRLKRLTNLERHLEEIQAKKGLPYVASTPEEQPQAQPRKARKPSEAARTKKFWADLKAEPYSNILCRYKILIRRRAAYRAAQTIEDRFLYGNNFRKIEKNEKQKHIDVSDAGGECVPS